MLKRAFGIAVLGAGFVLGAAAPARADDAETRAKAVARDATKLARMGKVTEAIAMWKQAVAIHPMYAALCNIGYAYQDQGKLARAHLFLERCTVEAQRQGKTVPADVGKALIAVEAKLRSSGEYGLVTLDIVPAGAVASVSAFEPDELVVTPRTIWVPVGEQEVRLTRDGYEPKTETVRADAGTPATLRAQLARAYTRPEPVKGDSPPAEGAARKPPPADTRGAPPLDRVGSSPRRRDVRRARWPLAIAGVGVVGLATGVVFHVRARAVLRDIDELEPVQPGFPNPAYDSKLESYHRDRMITYVSYAAGAVVTGVGVFLYLRSGNRKRVSASAGKDGVALWVRGEF